MVRALPDEDPCYLEVTAACSWCITSGISGGGDKSPCAMLSGSVLLLSAFCFVQAPLLQKESVALPGKHPCPLPRPLSISSPSLLPCHLAALIGAILIEFLFPSISVESLSPRQRVNRVYVEAKYVVITSLAVRQMPVSDPGCTPARGSKNPMCCQ